MIANLWIQYVIQKESFRHQRVLLHQYYLSLVSLKALIGRQSYYQVIRGNDLGKFKEDYPKGISRNGQDRIFAPKLDNPFCPMTDCHRAKASILF